MFFRCERTRPITHKGKEYLLICDLFSKYPFLSKITSKSAYSLSQHFQELISHHRPPSLIYTNNAPFTSSESATFLQCYYIDEITSSSHFPQSNGFIECQARTIKTMLGTTQDASRSLQELHLELQSTP